MIPRVTSLKKKKKERKKDLSSTKNENAGKHIQQGSLNRIGLNS